MENAGYAALTRQSGLMREMQVVANNMANMSDDRLPPRGRGLRRSRPRARRSARRCRWARRAPPSPPSFRARSPRPAGRSTSRSRGGLLPRRHARRRHAHPGGHFLRDAEGNVVTPDGMALLDAGGAPCRRADRRACDLGRLRRHAQRRRCAHRADRPLAGPGRRHDRTARRHPLRRRRRARPGRGRQRPHRRGFLESSNVNPVPRSRG
jgi:hypothetical protein